MHKILTVAAIVATAALVSSPAQAATERTSCNDVSYLRATIKSVRKSVTALKLAQNGRYGAALLPARRSLALAKTAPEPCDANYRLQRLYEIHYSVAVQRWLEEMRDGNDDSADIYWSSVKFWSTQVRDLSLEK